MGCDLSFLFKGRSRAPAIYHYISVGVWRCHRAGVCVKLPSSSSCTLHLNINDHFSMHSDWNRCATASHKSMLLYIIYWHVAVITASKANGNNFKTFLVLSNVFYIWSQSVICLNSVENELHEFHHIRSHMYHRKINKSVHHDSKANYQLTLLDIWRQWRKLCTLLCWCPHYLCFILIGQPPI